MPADFRVSITDRAGPDAYPISCFTWLLIRPGPDKDKGTAMVDFLRWMLTDGQNDCAAGLRSPSSRGRGSWR